MKRSFVVLFIIIIVCGYICAGDSRLHIAAREGLTQEVKDLLVRGANPFGTNEKGLMPVQNAANNEIRFMLVAAMNEYGAKVKKKE